MGETSARNMKIALLLLSIVGLALVCADLHTEDQYTEDANVMAVDDSTDEVDDSTDEMDDCTALEASTLRETEHQEPQQKKKKNSEPTAKSTSEPTAKSTSEPTAKPTSEPTAKSTSEPTVTPPATSDPTSEPTEAATDSQYVLLGKGTACGSSAEVTSNEKCFAASKTFDLPLHKNRNVNKAWLPTGCSVREVTKGKFEGKYVVFFNKATGKANPNSEPVCLNLPTDEPTSSTSSPTTALTMEPTLEPTEAATNSQYVLLAKATACRSSAELTSKEECFAASKTFDLPLHKNKKINKTWLPTGCSVREVTKGK